MRYSTRTISIVCYTFFCKKKTLFDKIINDICYLLSLFGVNFLVIFVCLRQLIKFLKIKQYFGCHFAFRVNILCLPLNTNKWRARKMTFHELTRALYVIATRRLYCDELNAMPLGWRCDATRMAWRCVAFYVKINSIFF